MSTEQKDLIKFEPRPDELKILFEVAEEFCHKITLCSYSHKNIKEGQNITNHNLIELLKDVMVAKAMIDPCAMSLDHLVDCLQRTLSTDTLKAAMGGEKRKEY